MVGIVDEALSVGGADDLKISSYKDALVDFVKRTDTPMTIGVQGEWGSGKTSLLNQIWNDLDYFNKNDDDIDDFKQKSKDSNDFKEAVKFLREYFDDKNKKRIDL